MEDKIDYYGDNKGFSFISKVQPITLVEAVIITQNTRQTAFISRKMC